MNKIDSNELDRIADYIAWSEEHGRRKRKFSIETGDTLTVNISTLNPESQAVARDALDAWSAVSGIRFEETESEDANIRFIHQEGAASANYPGHDNRSVVRVGEGPGFLTLTMLTIYKLR